MKIKYEFADGTVSEVEVEESIGEVIIEDRRQEDNLARKERYHCYSLDAAQFEGSEYGTEETPETKMERKQDTERIARALDGLSEVQRRRLLMLADGKSMREIAREEKVQHRAVYDSGSSPCSIGSRMFDGEAWYLRLVLEGEDRLFRNPASREQGWSVSYSAASEEWGELYSGYSGVESALDGIIRAETVESLLSVLTERQRRAAVLFYLEQKTERQVAEELGITAPAVSRILAKSLARMRTGNGTA